MRIEKSVKTDVMTVTYKITGKVNGCKLTQKEKPFPQPTADIGR